MGHELEPKDLKDLGKLNFGRWVRLDEDFYYAYYTGEKEAEHASIAQENGAHSQEGKPLVDDAGEFRVVADEQLEFVGFSNEVKYSGDLKKARGETIAIARKKFGIEAIFDPSEA